MIGRRRALNVFAMVDALRERHPELRAPLTASSLATVLRRERVRLLRLPVTAKEYVVGFPPAFTIVVSSKRHPRYHTRWAAHGLGHIKLHYDEFELGRQLAPCRRGDPREFEAELFARLLLIGPEATPEHPRIAPLVGALTAGALPKPAQQIALPIQETPRVVSPANAAYGVDDPRQHFYPKRTKGPIWIPAPHSPYFDWSKNGKPLGWFHRELGWMWVHDGARLTRRGVTHWEELPVGDPRAQVRVFVRGGDRRRYAFAEGEKRTRTIPALVRQFTAAVRHQPPIARVAARKHSSDR